jgi:aryl sulfotransferase
MPGLLSEPTRDFRTFVMDGRRWDDFEARSDDVVICTYSKCGTTWTQRIVDLLIFQTPAPRPVVDIAPWVDSVLFHTNQEDLATLAGQTHRRFMKTHMPFDALPVWDEVKYIHVARDGRDACMSFHNHMLNMRPEFRAHAMTENLQDARFMALMAERGPPPPTPEDPRAFYLDWIGAAEGEVIEAWGFDLPFFEFETTYWRERLRPNLLLVHYNDLKADLAGEMARIADFLEIETPEGVMSTLVEAAQFDSMKRDAETLVPMGEQAWNGGAKQFIFKGVNGRWREVLNEDDIARYEALAKRKWTSAQSAWIEGGRRMAGDPRQAPD